VTLLLVVLLGGPAQAIAGKYVQHSEEYRRARPASPVVRPDPLPPDVAGLCALVEAGLGDREVFLALGDALRKEGDAELAYRAYHRAARLGGDDAAWRREVRARQDDCHAYVPDAVIAAEEAEAAQWVAALQAYERRRLLHGEDPDDLADFYNVYGRPETSLVAVARRRRLSFVGGVVGVLLGGCCLAWSRRLRRRAALLPLGVALLCALGAVLTGVIGLFPVGAGAALLGGLAVALRGRRAPA